MTIEEIKASTRSCKQEIDFYNRQKSEERASDDIAGVWEQAKQSVEETMRELQDDLDRALRRKRQMSLF